MDLRAYDDLDPFAAECTDAYEELVQDCYHRLVEAPGSNPDDENRGLGIEDMLSGQVDPQWPRLIEAELRKDDRVTGSTARISQVDDTSLRIEITIEVDGLALGLALETAPDGTIIRVRPNA